MHVVVTGAYGRRRGNDLHLLQIFGSPLFTPLITLRASCGAVYCNRSCLWVGVFVWVCLITTIT